MKQVAALLSLLVLLGACKEEALYSKQTEAEANEIILALRGKGVDADKRADKDDLVTIFVGQKDFATALAILKDAGLPREKPDRIPALFPNDGMFSTPLQEGVRLKYALEQELASSILLIPGVRNARVHLVIPSLLDPDSRSPAEPSASVVMIHDPGFDETGIIMRVRKLVANSVEKLDHKRVNISLFEYTATTENSGDPKGVQ